MSEKDFIDAIKESLKEAENYETCMALSVHEDGRSVELLLDTARNYYGDWIKGEGGDICLYREQGTDKVVGCHLPLYNSRLCVHYDGPIRINAGFKKGYRP